MDLAKIILNEAQNALNEKRYAHSLAASLTLFGDENSFLSAVEILSYIPNIEERLPSNSILKEQIPQKEFILNIQHSTPALSQNTKSLIIVFELLNRLSLPKEAQKLTEAALIVSPQDHDLLLQSLLGIVNKADTDKVRKKLKSIINNSSISLSTEKQARFQLALLEHKNSNNRLATDIILNLSMENGSIPMPDKSLFLMLNICPSLNNQIIEVAENCALNHHNDDIAILIECKLKSRMGHSKQLLNNLEKISMSIKMLNDFYQIEFLKLRNSIFTQLGLSNEIKSSLT